MSSVWRLPRQTQHGGPVVTPGSQVLVVAAAPPPHVLGSAPAPGEQGLNLMLRFHLPQSVADGGSSFQAQALVGISAAVSPVIFTKMH